MSKSKLAEAIEMATPYSANDLSSEKKLPSQDVGAIESEIKSLPKDTPSLQLPSLLDPILRKIAMLENTASGDMLLRHTIGDHFDLTSNDTKSFGEVLRKYRKKPSEPLCAKPSQGGTPTTYTAILENLVDLVSYNGSPAFLFKEGDKLSIVTQFEKDGVIYLPPPKEQIPWLLPRGEEVLELYNLQKVLPQQNVDDALYLDLLAYHKEISELPAEEYYDLIVAWDFHTYLLEAVQYSPIVCLFAVPERGKSRTGKGMIHVAYRGIHVESLRDAYIVRVANDLNASLFFDVKDIWLKAEKNGSEDILLHRFEKGAKVPRVNNPDRGAHKDIVYYSIFGPTIIGTNEGVHQILETRAVQINMPPTGKNFENDVTPELSLPLKERLILFRANYLGEMLPTAVKPANGRLGDILKPLQQIIRLVKPERESSFLNLVRRLEAERLIEKSDSLESQILRTVVKLYHEVKNGILPVKTVTDNFNEDKSEKERVTSQRVGRRLSAMGFGKGKTGTGAAAILWDEAKIERMKKAYGLEQTSETSEMSESSVS